MPEGVRGFWTLWADDSNLEGTDVLVAKQGEGDFEYNEGLNVDSANAVFKSSMFNTEHYAFYVKYTVAEQESRALDIATIALLPVGHLDYDIHQGLHFVVNGESTQIGMLRGPGKENQIALSYDGNTLTTLVNR